MPRIDTTTHISANSHEISIALHSVHQKVNNAFNTHFKVYHHFLMLSLTNIFNEIIIITC